MRKTIVMFALAAACAGLALGQEVKILDSTPFSYAGLSCSGSYEQMGLKIGQFMQEFFKQKLTPAGPPFGLYLNTPREVKPEDLKWEIGFPVAKDAVVAEPLKKGEYGFRKVASAIHTGPYDKVGETYARMLKFVEANGYRVAGPCLEKYLNNPMQVKPEELKTEVIMPVEPVKK
jgi:AraC family transcriptional regulator